MRLEMAPRQLHGPTRLESRLRPGRLAVEAGADGRHTEASMEIAGQAAFLAPELVRCRRGCVTYSTAGACAFGLGHVKSTIF